MVVTFWLVLGYACNNRCPHCYALPTNLIGSWMGLEYAKQVMRAMKTEGARNCLLIGGEPTLYPHLVEVITYGYSLGFDMVAVTNGRRLKDRMFTKKLFDAGLSRPVVSIEGASSAIHNELTGRSSFDDTCNGIKVSAALKKVATITTICRRNQHEIANIVRLAYSLGAYKAILNCAIPTVDNCVSIADQTLSPQELATVVEKNFWELKDSDTPFQISATFPLCLMGRETLALMFKKGWLSVGCHMYRGKGVVFDPAGNILPCTHFTKDPLVEGCKNKDGNFTLETSFSAIWSEPVGLPARFRSTLWTYPADKCNGCEFWGACIGGCPLLWTHFDPLVQIDRKEVNV